LPALQVAFMRFLVHLIWVVLIYAPREGAQLLQTRVRGIQLLRGALLTGATLLNFTALKYLPLPVTISIFFAGPMLVCLLSIPILGEKVGPKRFAAVAAGFAGVLVWLDELRLLVLRALPSDSRRKRQWHHTILCSNSRHFDPGATRYQSMGVARKLAELVSARITG